MNAHDTLHVFCRRHGVPESYGRRLLPLLKRAHAAPPEIRERLLRLVEQNLVQEASRRKGLRNRAVTESEQALGGIAAVLHAWAPPDWLEKWTDRPGC